MLTEEELRCIRDGVVARGRLGITKDNIMATIDTAIASRRLNDELTRALGQRDIKGDVEDALRKLAAIQAILGPTPGPVG